MAFNTESPVRHWDLEEYDGDKILDMWEAFNALPEGSVVATGFLDDGLVYFEKTGADWRVVQVDNPNVEDVLPVGTGSDGDPSVLDAGGDIETAYVIRVGA